MRLERNGEHMNASERLIVAADFSPKKCGGPMGAYGKVMELAHALRGTGVSLKVNSVLRARGIELIDELHELGLGVMADFKLNDISNTMETDGEFLTYCKPELLTVMASAGANGIRKLRAALSPKTELLGVTVFTSFNDAESERIYHAPCWDTFLQLAFTAEEGGVNGLVMSGDELKKLQARKIFGGLTWNIPAIRPAWYKDPKDDQLRVVTPAEAITDGATRIIVGRPIVGAKQNDLGQPQSPREAVEWTLREIEQTLAT